METNTCLILNESLRTIAYYSHLIPVGISVALGIFVLRKAQFSLPSKIFSLFIASFCLWLIGDVITWTSGNYDLISAVWAPLDYINILFYLLSVYFFVVLFRGKDLNLWQTTLLFSLALPAWWITISNQSISYFYQPVCEALNNDFLSQYKLIIEVLVMALIMFYAFIAGRKSDKARIARIITVALAIILFYSSFTVTEYIASTTGNYEINLYSLFILPVFLFIIIYAISNLGVFRIRRIGFQFLAYLLVLMVGSQFFFLQSSTNKAITVLTFVLSLGFAVLLIRSGMREEEALKKAEELTEKLAKANSVLKELDRQKDELLGLVSHQLATPVSSLKWYLEMMKDGDIGQLTVEQKEHVTTMYGIGNALSDLVGMILDVSRIQLGRITIEKSELDLKELFKEILVEVRPKAKEKTQHFEIHLPTHWPKAMLDRRFTRMIIQNLLTNAIKYTPEKGTVKLTVSIKNDSMLCEVQDTGCGIPKPDQGNIFGRMFRASNVRNSVDGNGFGLYIAKGAVEAQGGKIRFESEEGNGTTFVVELPLSV